MMNLSVILMKNTEEEEKIIDIDPASEYEQEGDD